MDGMGLETKKNTSFQSPHHHVWNWDDGLGDPIPYMPKVLIFVHDFPTRTSQHMFMKFSIWSGYVAMLGFDTFQNLEKISFNYYIFSDCQKAYTPEMQNG